MQLLYVRRVRGMKGLQTMNTTPRAALWPGLIFVLAAGLAGCANHSRQNTIPTAPAMQSAGASMQKEGIMSQSDYVRVDGLAHQVAQTHTISDTDLDWTVTHLDMQKNSIARARFFDTLFEIRPMSAAQKAKILPVITPYLRSADGLDQVGARRTQKAMQASS